MTRKLTKEEFILRSKRVQAAVWDYSQVVYVNSTTNVTIICPTHGPFDQTPKMHMTGQGCNKCSTARAAKLITSDTEDFLPKVLAVHSTTYDLSRTVYVKHNELVEVGCYKHGPFFLTPNKLLAGRGCQKCSKERKLETSLKAATKSFFDRTEGSEDCDYSLVKYVGAKAPVEIICKHGHPNFFQAPDSHLSGQGCPRCAKNGFQPDKEGILYILSDGELTKVGITNKSLPRRLRSVRKTSGRDFKVLTYIQFRDGQVVTDIETKLLTKYRLTHESPTEVFDGYSECFYDVDYNTLLLDVVKFCSELLPASIT